MATGFGTQHVASGILHLRSADNTMRDVIDAVGPFTLRAKRDRFGMLVGSIISQQISTKAAASIRRRVQELTAPEKLSPVSLSEVRDRQLRQAGLSERKLSYIRDLCDKVDNGEVELRTIGRKTDEEIIAQLTSIRGIGRWTAQMFLMFSLARLDVFPHDDLGIRMALRQMYGLNDLPNKSTSLEIAQPWQPYSTIASWYCWRSLELQ